MENVPALGGQIKFFGVVQKFSVKFLIINPNSFINNGHTGFLRNFCSPRLARGIQEALDFLWGDCKIMFKLFYGKKPSQLNLGCSG